MIVKGVASYGDRTRTSSSAWASFASTMAASVVASTILKDPAVFKEWPDYNEGESNLSETKLTVSFLGEKHLKLEFRVNKVLPIMSRKWQRKRLGIYLALL